MTIMIDGVKFDTDIPDMTHEEAARYVEYVRARVTEPVKIVTATLCSDGKVDVSYLARGEKFERIRRITGYLTGDLTTWNDAKRSEESERVKHDGGEGYYEFRTDTLT